MAKLNYFSERPNKLKESFFLKYFWLTTMLIDHYDHYIGNKSVNGKY